MKDRPKDAEKSLQWLRGWTSQQTIHNEFSELQNYSHASNSCLVCSKQSIKCDHPRPTFWDKMQELKRKRTLKPMILVFSLHFILEFCIVTVWQPYIIQVLNAFGTPINANVATVVSACLGISACFVLISTVKKFGRRRLYLTSSLIVTVCTFGLSEFSCDAELESLEIISIQFQAFSGSSSSHRAGYHFSKVQLIPPINTSTFAVLSAITAI